MRGRKGRKILKIVKMTAAAKGSNMIPNYVSVPNTISPIPWPFLQPPPPFYPRPRAGEKGIAGRRPAAGWGGIKYSWLLGKLYDLAIAEEGKKKKEEGKS